jgi:SAM-dependent methyltransferase
MTANAPINLWTSTEHAHQYLERADSLSHRGEGESALLEFIPKTARRILDLGTGDGRLLALAKLSLRKDGVHETEAVALDFSPAMIEAARKRFVGDSSVTVMTHNLDRRLPPWASSTPSFPASRSIMSFTNASVSCMQKFTACSTRAAYSAIWNMPHRLRRACTQSSWSASASRSRPKIRPTNCWTLKRSCSGCARLASLTWIVTGNGGSWRYWQDGFDKPNLFDRVRCAFVIQPAAGSARCTLLAESKDPLHLDPSNGPSRDSGLISRRKIFCGVPAITGNAGILRLRSG